MVGRRRTRRERGSAAESGRRIPRFAWPNGARLAVTLTIGWEMWAQTAEPNLLAPFPPELLAEGRVDLGTLSWAEYGGRAGIWRVMRILERHGSPRMTVAANGGVVEQFPDAARALVEQGHELCGHSYRQDILPYRLDREQELANIQRSVQAIESVTGVRPVGWISPAGRPSEHTRELLAAEGFLWHGDCSDDDLPYVEQTPAGPIVAVPYLCYDINDYHLYARGRSSPSVYTEMFKRSFSMLLAEAKASGEPRMINASIHAHIFGRSAGAWAFEDCIAYASRQKKDVWFASRSDLARIVKKAWDAGGAA